MNLSTITSKLEESWKSTLQTEFNAPYFNSLVQFLNEEQKEKIIFPKIEDIFTVYNLIPLQKVKVVILGQDPYHGINQAHGLSFSVKRGNKQPPSLVNIFKELESDLNIPRPEKHNGDLESWAKQGVFLLNSVLTVEQSQPNSHKNKGWEKFTDATIQAISNKLERVVFVLWGNYAKQKRTLIDETKHHVITSVHPSPFSARNGFFGSKPFSEINAYLKKNNHSSIHWKIS